jgi:hypothetical protein
MIQKIIGYKKLVVLSCFLSLIFLGFSQEKNWTIDKSKDGNVTVKSRVEEGKNKSGDDIKIMYYVVEKVGKLTLEQAEKYLRNSANYKFILESTLESRELKKISDDEWQMYLFFDAIWPMPKSDCVQQVVFERTGKNGFKIKAEAIPAPDLKTGVERVSIYSTLYEVEKINEHEIKLVLTVTSSPVINPPKFLIKPWFPKGPTGMVTRFFEGAAKEISTN